MSASNGAYFVLFASCLAVRGARRGALCDVQRGGVQPVPLGLIDIVDRCRSQPVTAVLASLGAEDQATAEEYLKFLEQQDFGFYTDEPERFLPLPLEWDHPSLITNAIVDVDATKEPHYDQLALELDSVGVKAVQWRYPSRIARESLERMLSALDATRIQHVEMVLPYASKLTPEDERFLPLRYQRLSTIRYFGASASARRVEADSGCSIFEVPGALLLDACCSLDPFGNFACNVEVFTEQQRHHVCLNRKVYIDADGVVRNCPSTQRSYGVIGASPLREIIKGEAFIRLGRVSRDQMSVCADCEFRYVCVASDCAAVERHYPGPFPKPRICGYDPYQATHRH